MAKISLAGFKDPVRRPRYIIWALVAVLVVAGVMVPVLGITSTRWFCAEGCHKVQDDTILAYEASSHSKISCMACHMPVATNPVIFLIHKAEALGELYLTVRDDFELPLNAESEVALTMASKQCVQCHNLETRPVTPSPGIKIDHPPHAEINAACPVCHNRIAHNENFELTLTDPKTGEPNQKHANFMTMTACYRCHGLEKGAAAPGRCSACHTSDFELKPDNHNEANFKRQGHAEMAKEAQAEVAKAKAEAASPEGEAETSEQEGEAEKQNETPKEEKQSEETSFLGVEKAYAQSSGEPVEQATKEEVPEVIAAQRSHGAERLRVDRRGAAAGRDHLLLRHLPPRDLLHQLPRHGDAAPQGVQGAGEAHRSSGPPGHLEGQAQEVRHVSRRQREDPLLRRVPPRNPGRRMEVRSEGPVDCQAAPAGRRGRRREGVHREVPHRQVLRDLPLAGQGRADFAQAEELDQAEASGSPHGLR